ncbi:hypothetical protein JOF56_010723 [Kibdelosporangium banguiense]|uniref:Uncharacterized protein n=1 Tax=Kibdelosporangium banguiense TaxID=1365924 RepID=A0ABS4U290_9PSEU|nr:hypothetical protein [Kibdelosporangium banguiense]MBP2330338.1 hypothetical protein [Kibdelosporangium banguiense]
MTKYRMAELGLPGFAVGFIAGTVAGAMALVVGQPIGWALVTAVTLAVPLGLLGAGYSLLVAFGRVRLGGFAPAFLFWLFAFPLARLLQEVLTRLVLTGKPGFPPQAWGFLAFQAIISAGFAIGFLWMHERLAPRWWHRIADHNPTARRVYERYAAHAHVMWEARARRRAMSNSR